LCSASDSIGSSSGIDRRSSGVWVEQTDPASKDAVFYLSGESARRPEVRRHHERLARIAPDGNILLRDDGVDMVEGEFDEIWDLVPPFGPVPPALDQTYPLTAELPERTDRDAYRAAASGIGRLADVSDASLTVAHDGWPNSVLDVLPDTVTVVGPADKER